MMKDIQDTLPDMLAPATLDAIIDLVETTLLYPCSCPESRMGLWSELCSRLRGWRGRLGTREFGVLKDIGVMLGGSELLDDSLLAAPALPPLGADRPLLRVLLYTLQDGVGERVTRLLAALAPHVRVQTSSALDGERRLRELAAGADIVVICWAAATHAATVAIQSVVADKRRIIYPSGKGSSSALRAIVDVAKAA
jgi:hypothetical protein